MIRFTKAKTKPTPKKQKGKKKAVLNKLKSFLTKAEPDVVKILLQNWQSQENSVTYKELREAYLAGGISQKQFEKWQMDYAKLVNTALLPKFQQAADTAAKAMEAEYPYFIYEPSISAAAQYVKQHGAELVTNLAMEQKNAVNAMIQHTTGYTQVTPDEAARMIRPCIGLTKPQAMANLHYRDRIKQAYLKANPGKLITAEKKAKEAAARYAARQHRYRAMNIARTELAYAYNAGSYGATKDAQDKGYIGDCLKVWVTADDERMCDHCRRLDNEKRNMDELFSCGVMMPPAHPNCRCAVAYEEIEGTNLTPDTQTATINAEPIEVQTQDIEPPEEPKPIPPLPMAGEIQPTDEWKPDITDFKKPEGGYSIVDIKNNLDLLPANQHGTAVRSDGGMVEGLNMTGRRVKLDNGSEYYEFSGKLREDAWTAAAENARKRGMSRDMEFMMRNPTTGEYVVKDPGFKLPGYKIMDTNQSSFEIYSDHLTKKEYSMGGYFRVRVPVTGNQAADSKAVEQIFDKAGLMKLTADPTDADELLLKKSRIAWQRDPNAMAAIEHASTAKRKTEIDAILANHGITDKRVAQMELREVFPGYSTYVDAGAAMEYRKAGLTHIWAGVDSADSVVAICQSDGFAATNYRITSGMKKCGASPGADMGTGGADSVFTRIGVAGSKKEYRRCYLGDTYRVIINPDVMNRTDWYAYDHDNYGNAHISDLESRMSPVRFIEEMKDMYANGNEIMFRHGISTDTFLGISCQDDNAKARLVMAFKDAGITEFNGVPIDKFVHVSQKVGEDSLLGVEGLDHYDKPF